VLQSARLVIRDDFEHQYLPLLLAAPGMLRLLRELTLARILWDGDWTAVFAHQRELRRLTVDRCIRAADILRAVAGAVDDDAADDDAADAAAADDPAAIRILSQLRHLRIAPSILTHSHAWSAALQPFGDPCSPSHHNLSLLLMRRPDVRIELRIGFDLAGVSASWLLPPRSECDWQTATPRWTDFRLLHPLRHQFRDHLPLFSDESLGWEAREVDGSQEE